MRLFKISGKFEQNGKWSNREADFIGYFIKRTEENDVIEGYMEEQYETPNDKIRYIKGNYLENLSQLVFLKMINSDYYSPLVYTFADISKEGFWDRYDMYYGFFYKGTNQGHARVNIQEITEDVEKAQLIEQVISTFEEKSSRATHINRCFMEQTLVLMDFLKAPYYPKD